MSYLHQPKNMVLCSTHDLNMTEYLNRKYDYYYFSETIEDDRYTFDFKLKSESLTNKNAIRILELNDFPKNITDEAKATAKQPNDLRKRMWCSFFTEK